ncbi:hypothetical protein J2W39_000081 [Variovorax paradoxus]|uniref:Phosphoribosyl-AMP cyclohydrolase n=1 Tax=Variovorax paradoxus TaxID=34073 RepID=A0AAW8E7P0_VARPD|nr:hypothetical protein [Variovorax paradoxus]MDP9968858.1 hypothetical protein [Variovorax paradoxus]
MKRITHIAIASLLIGGAILPAAAKDKVADHGITEPEVLNAQRDWCKALLAISAANASGGQAAAKALAEKVIDGAYAYQKGAVLFKPTLAASPQTFRTARDGALAYFVGGNPAFPNDTGFALKGWTKCEIENSAVLIHNDMANTMGNVLFTGPDGKVTTVDKTWAFVKDDAGKLRIVVHHSSLPYASR